MTEREISSLMMWVGALHDIGEKTHEWNTKKQIAEVQQRIEDLIKNSKIHEKFLITKTKYL